MFSINVYVQVHHILNQSRLMVSIYFVHVPTLSYWYIFTELIQNPEDLDVTLTSLIAT